MNQEVAFKDCEEQSKAGGEVLLSTKNNTFSIYIKCRYNI